MFVLSFQVSNTEFRVTGSEKYPYFVHSDIGACTCKASVNTGSGPCKHQAAVAKYFPESEQFHLLGSISLNQKEKLIYIASGMYAR